MQIFVTSGDSKECAQVLDNRRLFKAILETVQILSTVQWMYGEWCESMYRPTHPKHPCVQWASRNRRNYRWLYRHLGYLVAEWHFRGYNPPREIELKLSLLKACPDDMPRTNDKDGYSPAFVNCTPYRELPVFEAYQKHLNIKWNNSRSIWTKRNPPEWRDTSANLESHRSGSGERNPNSTTELQS